MMICKHTFKRLTNENPFNILLKPRGKQSLFTLKLPEHIHPQGLSVLLGQGVFTNHKPFVSISHSQLGEAVKREVTLVFHTSLTGLFRPALERAFPSVAWWGRTCPLGKDGRECQACPAGHFGSGDQGGSSPYPWFCFPEFQLPAVSRGRKILSGKFQKRTIHKL